MRMLDEDGDRKVDRLTLYLTQAEAEELRDSLEGVLKGPRGNHAHIPSADFQKEVTIVIYDDGQLDEFDERSKRLILEDT